MRRGRARGTSSGRSNIMKSIPVTRSHYTRPSEKPQRILLWPTGDPANYCNSYRSWFGYNRAKAGRARHDGHNGQTSRPHLSLVPTQPSSSKTTVYCTSGQQLNDPRLVGNARLGRCRWKKQEEGPALSDMHTIRAGNGLVGHCDSLTTRQAQGDRDRLRRGLGSF